MLLSSTRAWPWGLAVLGDPDDRSPIPTSLGPEAVVAGQATVVCRILHAIDGEATATATLNQDADASRMFLAYEGPLELTSGLLRLGDAANEEAVECHVPAGRYTVRVFHDEFDHPNEVLFAS